MSRRRHRNRSENIPNPQAQPNNMNPMGNPMGFNPNQLMDMLGGNFDMGQIASLLAGMSGEGFNMNSFANLANMFNMNNSAPNMGNMGNTNGMGNMGNLGGLGNMGGLGNLGNLAGLGGLGGLGDIGNIISMMGLGNMGGNSSNNFSDNSAYNENVNFSEASTEEVTDDDRNMQMMKAMRRIVDPERVKFIDRVIDLYEKGKFYD